MKILVTGAKGFVGKNLVCELKNKGFSDVFEFDIDTDINLLEEYTKKCEFIFHLAGVNRPQNEGEFMSGNRDFTTILLNNLRKNKNTCPILVSSSIQAALENPYGLSKRAGEELMQSFEKETGARIFIYRLPNVFGKWCRPNYNSAVATFCHNVIRDIPITVNDPSVIMNLVYIDDVVNEFISRMDKYKAVEDGFYCIPTVYTIQLGEIVELIESFKDGRKILSIASMADGFTKKLYSTYLSYLPEDGFSYPLKMNVDNRGSFTEFIKTLDRGQVSVNISKPKITKGNHWHHSKNEKFLVVSGKGVIRFRKIDSEAIIEYYVSGEKLEVVDIPPGYTHNIENLGKTDMVTIMWANEPFNPDKPDTYFSEV